MSTTLEPKAKLKSPKNETLLFEANLENSNICIPKRLRWDEITKDQSWKLEEIVQPKPLKLNKEVSNIIEHTDGNIEIIFGKDKIESARHSTYIPEASSSSSLDEKLYNLRRCQSMKFKGVDFNRSIPQPLYEEDNKSDDTYNPTKSEVEYYREERT